MGLFSDALNLAKQDFLIMQLHPRANVFDQLEPSLSVITRFDRAKLQVGMNHHNLLHRAVRHQFNLHGGKLYIGVWFQRHEITDLLPWRRRAIP